jgi:N-acetylneuraminate synthase
MDKEDLKLFWQKWAHIKSSLGTYELTALPSEEPARRNARRSLVAAQSIPAGKVIEA